LKRSIGAISKSDSIAREAGKPRRAIDHRVGAPSFRAQIAHTCIAVGFAQLPGRGLHQEIVMKKRRWMPAPEQSCELNLPAGRVEQILAAYDEVHVLQPVIDDDGELIGPVAVSIADQQIAALFGGLLLLPPKPEIVEPFDRRLQSQPDPNAG
jgi:hypothetical protein